jgi:NAD+ synthase (glutamine-hydrolysing)
MGAETIYQPHDSFVRVATACPEVEVGDIEANIAHMQGLYEEATRQGAGVVVFPELSLTGYTLGDYLQHNIVLERSKQGLLDLAEETKETETAMIVGLPMTVGNTTYNCAAVLAKGEVRGIVPKSFLPGQHEFYEERWFRPWQGENTEVKIGDKKVPFGTDMTFQIGNAQLGVEICEDLWVPEQPSIKLAEAGATIIANPSASPEQVGKDGYRRNLVAQQAGRLACAYVYAGAGSSESTTDLVFGGHQIIAENGTMLAERKPLSMGQELTFTDVDVQHMMHERRLNPNFRTRELPVIECDITPTQEDLRRDIDRTPFIPKGPEASARLQYILDMQGQALATRMEKTGRRTVALGLSGGLDSTLALLVAMNAAQRLGVAPQDMIHTVTMPGEASSEHTQSNAVRLAHALDLPNEVVPIGEIAQIELKLIRHDGETQDVAYENVQARARTELLFNRANLKPEEKMIVLGTGDMSEIALGWCTFNGDHMSHYNVNAGVPKTLVRYLVDHASKQCAPAVYNILQSILDTPISPELTTSGTGDISQKTEDLIGPYELHDFTLYHMMRWGDDPQKIAYMADQAFAGIYTPDEIRMWQRKFYERFFGSQWKRSVSTDAVKVGSVALGSRWMLKAPSDMVGTLWLNATRQWQDATMAA